MIMIRRVKPALSPADGRLGIISPLLGGERKTDEVFQQNSVHISELEVFHCISHKFSFLFPFYFTLISHLLFAVATCTASK